MIARSPGLNYSDYLALDRLLDCQMRESERRGQPAHDEMLFIVVHQAYELWFKQILFELTATQRVFAGAVVDDRAIAGAAHGLDRITEILRLLIQQLTVLETMTPLDFLDFRDLLFPASGSQSLQFRLIETRLGLRPRDRLSHDGKPFDAGLRPADRRQLERAALEPPLFDQIGRWLERTPFIAMDGFDFGGVYRQVVDQMLAADAARLRAGPAADQPRTSDLESLGTARARFDALFDEARHAELMQQGVWRLSAKALQAALFINLYRDEPVLQLPFRLLSLLMDIDENLTTWRYRHALMVQRMIGVKLGTGGSSGHDYLRQAAEKHRVFGDLFALSTFFIPRSRLPALPPALRRAMDYRYAQPEKP